MSSKSSVVRCLTIENPGISKIHAVSQVLQTRTDIAGVMWQLTQHADANLQFASLNSLSGKLMTYIKPGLAQFQRCIISHLAPMQRLVLLQLFWPFCHLAVSRQVFSCHVNGDVRCYVQACACASLNLASHRAVVSRVTRRVCCREVNHAEHNLVRTQQSQHFWHQQRHQTSR